MLTPEQIEALMVIFDERSQTIEDEYLKRLGQHMHDFGEILPSDVHQLAQLKRMNRNFDELKRKMSKVLSMDAKSVDEMLVKVAKYNLDYAELQFGKGLTDEQRKAKRAACARSLALMVSAQSKVTKGEMRNLSQTTILSTNYRQCVDTAIHAVQTGMRDYQSEIRSVMRKTSREGLRVLYPNSGMTRRLDSAVRMNVLDGVRSLNQQAALECGRTYGADGVEVSAHPLCALDHVPIQGQQYSNAEFDRLQNELDREIGQWNCKHFAFPIILDISQAAYSADQLQAYADYSKEEIEIDGHKHSRYEWSQVQRRLETNARYINDDRTLFKASGDTAAVTDCDTKFEKNLLKYQDICAKAGLEPDYSRMRGTSYPDSAFKGILGREYREGEQQQTDFVKLRVNSILKTDQNNGIMYASNRDSNGDNAHRKRGILGNKIDAAKRDMQWMPYEKPYRSMKTVREVEESLRASNWFGRVSLNGCSIEGAKSIAASFNRVFSNYPELVGFVRGVRVTSMGDEAFAGFDPNTKEILINLFDYGNEFADATKQYSMLANNGLFPISTDIRSVCVHEIGHAIDMYLSQIKQEPISESLCRRFFESIGIETIAGCKDYTETNLSKNARRNAKEMLADAFSEYLTSPNPRDIAQWYGKEINLLLKGVIP